jgi:hypothetical protein
MQISQVVVRTIQGHEIEFVFYKETYNDLLYRFGDIFKEDYHGYIVHAKFDKDLPPVLYQFNNLKHFFKGKTYPWIPEDVVCQVLLSIYLNMLKREMEVGHFPKED